MGWQSTMCAIVQRPSLFWNCTGTPASNFVEERIAQPWALTTKVSHTSEKSEFGSRLVTSIGRASGSLELRRRSGKFGACIVGFLFFATGARLGPWPLLE